MFDALLHKRLRPLLLAFLLSANFVRGENAAPPPSTAPAAEVVVLSPPSSATPSDAENQKQRMLLTGLMAVLLGIGAWRQFRRRV